MFRVLWLIVLVSLVGCAGHARPQLQPDLLEVGDLRISADHEDEVAVSLVLKDEGVRVITGRSLSPLECQVKWFNNGSFVRWTIYLQCRLGYREMTAEDSHRAPGRDDDVTDAYAIQQAARKVAEKMRKAAR